MQRVMHHSSSSSLVSSEATFLYAFSLIAHPNKYSRQCQHLTNFSSVSSWTPKLFTRVLKSLWKDTCYSLNYLDTIRHTQSLMRVKDSSRLKPFTCICNTLRSTVFLMHKTIAIFLLLVITRPYL